MHSLSLAHGAIWLIAALSTLGMLLRPWKVPDAAWMFDRLAMVAARQARGSAQRLFALVYAAGVIVTALLSNDATAVVLTPAVYAVARAVRAPPLPYLYVCAFIANAASFVLPMSNPANLLVFGDHPPTLGAWLMQFALPSLAAIALTFLVLYLTQRRWLRRPITCPAEPVPLSAAGRVATGGILATAGMLMAASALAIPLGAPTCIAGVGTALMAQRRARQPLRLLLRAIPWSVLPLVAGLFVLVAGINSTGLLQSLGSGLAQATGHSHAQTLGVGVAIALICNVTNNLPLALIAGAALQAHPPAMPWVGLHLPASLSRTVLVAVDLGPNLSVTGSLATILWLNALRRDGDPVSAWQFFALGARVMLPALLVSLVLVLTG